MNLTPVESSQIHAVGYDAATQKLQLQFYKKGREPGSIYEYDNVQPKHYEALMGAPSIGSWFSNNIKNNPAMFPYRKIG